MSKQAFLDTVKAQNYILTEAQKAKVKSFLIENEVSRDDIPELKKIAEKNGVDFKKGVEWYKKQTNLEDATKRTANSKEFQDPTDETKRVIVMGGAGRHAWNGTEWVDRPKLSFPSGKVLPAGKTNHEILTVPEWVKLSVNEDGTEAYAYDQKDSLLMTYTHPIVTMNGEFPYEISLDGKFQRYGEKITDVDSLINETIVRNKKAQDAKFVVRGNQLGFQISKKASEFELQAWDDTTAGTLDGDTFLDSINSTSNYSSAAEIQTIRYGGRIQRSVLEWTLPSDPGGTVTDVKMTLTTSFNQGSNLHDVHEVTESGAVISQMTWNNYATGSAWSTGGGDFSGTIIDSFTCSADETAYDSYLMGAGASNPLTLDWGDSVMVVVKRNNETTNTLNRSYWSSDENGDGSGPTLEITYTAGGGSTFKPRVIMF